MRYASPITENVIIFAPSTDSDTPTENIRNHRDPEAMILSKQVTKIVQNLEKKKFREKYNLFKTEGEKLVEELLRSRLSVETLIALPQWFGQHPVNPENTTLYEASEADMQRLSNFQSPPAVIALARIPAYDPDDNDLHDNLTLALNGIQDPGNMGTILRIADWFGIRQVFCDDDCANIYNPKCVQASMGAIFRVRTFYTDLPRMLQTAGNAGLPIFGTFLDGENLYTTPLPSRGIIVMGNEGKGIAAGIRELTTCRLTIPGFGGGSESLNVGVATGIVLSEFKRRIYL